MLNTQNKLHTSHYMPGTQYKLHTSNCMLGTNYKLHTAHYLLGTHYKLDTQYMIGAHYMLDTCYKLYTCHTTVIPVFNRIFDPSPDLHVFLFLSQIRKLNLHSCWCFEIFYYLTFFIHGSFCMNPHLYVGAIKI